MRWNAVSVESSQPDTPNRPGNDKRAGKKAVAVSKQIETITGPTAADALDRIKFPQEALDRIGEALIPGSSLIISDLGLGKETGRYTEFIVATH